MADITKIQPMGDENQYELGARYLTTGRTISISDNDATNTGPASSAFNGTANLTVKLPSTIKASLTGNASTATTLQTARTINGTSFNGSANITTANWGTARIITIGNTGKSVNGSGNVSWTQDEMGVVKKTVVTTATDFNSLSADGFYAIKVANCPNNPTPSNHGLLISCNNVGTPLQFWSPDNSNTVYKRWIPSGGSWTSWAILEANPKSHTHAYLPYSEVASLDANSCSPGLYCVRAAITNAPTTNHGLLLYINNLGTPFQMFYPDNQRVIYKRWYTSGAWTGWGIMNAAWS